MSKPFDCILYNLNVRPNLTFIKNIAILKD